MVQIDLGLLIRREKERRLCKDSPQKPSASSSGRGQQGAEAAAAVLRDGAATQAELQPESLRVGQAYVQGLSYVPDFLSREEADAAVHAIEATSQKRWVSAGERRMQNWGGHPGAARLEEALPPFLAALVCKLVAAGVYSQRDAPNHVLINEYAHGAGISPHQDGPLYLDRVATITLLGPALLSLQPASTSADDCEPLTSVLLRPNCLLVVSGQAYSECVHGIASRDRDTITERCCNAAAAGAAVDDIVARARRRYSLVFVHKRQPPA